MDAIYVAEKYRFRWAGIVSAPPPNQLLRAASNWALRIVVDLYFWRIDGSKPYSWNIDAYIITDSYVSVLSFIDLV